MMFSNIKKVWQTVNAHNITGRVKIKKIKNDITILHVVCEEGCP
jgi:hypothetical protein